MKKTRAKKDAPSAKAPLAAVFTGHCRLEIPGVPAEALQDTHPLSCDIVFSAPRDAVTLVDFDSIRPREDCAPGRRHRGRVPDGRDRPAAAASLG